MTERERFEAVIWHFLREAEPEWESGKCAIYAEDLAGRIMPLLRSEPVGEPVANTFRSDLFAGAWAGYIGPHGFDADNCPLFYDGCCCPPSVPTEGWTEAHDSCGCERVGGERHLADPGSVHLTDLPAPAAPTRSTVSPSAPTEGGEPDEKWDEMKARHHREACAWQRRHGITTREQQRIWQESGKLPVPPVSAAGEEER